MQTNFAPEQLRDPAMQSSEKILRTCVHCGFCTATCPTYLLLGDELDSPRGRIYLMKEMLESGKPATPEIVKHIDRCLSFLSCMTTCPSGVHYMHLVDHGRAYIEETYRRPWHDRVAILSGCAQPVLKPGFNEAAIRLLNRHGVEVVQPKGEGCCGALVHHMGRDEESHGFAKRNIDAWIAEMDGEGLDAIVITASGCGTTVKDYGFMFRDDPAYAAKAKRVSEMTKDITEFMASIKLMSPV